MAIGFRNAAGGVFASSNSFACALPAATAAGDLMVMTITTFVGGGAHVPNVPAGWTQQTVLTGLSLGGVANSVVQIISRRATGAEASVTVTIDQNQFLDHNVTGFTGVDASVPIEVAVLTTTAAGTSANCPNSTALTDNAAVLCISVNEDGGANAISAVPAGTAVTTNILDGNGSLQNCGSWKLLASHGPVGVLTYAYAIHTPLVPIVTGTVILRQSGAVPFHPPAAGAAGVFAVAGMAKGLRLGLGQSKGQGKGKGQGGGSGQHPPPPAPPPQPPPVVPPQPPQPPASTQARRKAASDIRRRRGV